MLDPPYFIVRPRVIYQRLQSQAISFPCVAKGVPTPHISWRKVYVELKLLNFYRLSISWMHSSLLGYFTLKFCMKLKKRLQYVNMYIMLESNQPYPQTLKSWGRLQTNHNLIYLFI